MEITCPTCEGGGVTYYEPPGWWHGSGVFTEEYTCTDCAGTGVVLEAPADPAEEPEPTEEQRQEWAQRDLDRIRLSDLV